LGVYIRNDSYSSGISTSGMENRKDDTTWQIMEKEVVWK